MCGFGFWKVLLAIFGLITKCFKEDYTDQKAQLSQ